MDEHTGAAFEVELEPRSDRYDADHEGWQAQVAEFHAMLQAELGGVRVERTAVPGTRGGAGAVILALGSAGAFTAAVECFRAWLARDKTRTVALRWSLGDGGDDASLVLDGATDAASLAPVIEAIARKIGGGPWPATEPS